MNILVIGNGFDLAHGLPTKYPHFLEFCKRVFPIYENAEGRGVHLYQQEYLLEWDFNIEIKEGLKSAYDSRRKVIVDGNIAQIETIYPRTDELYALIKDNIWIEYFLQCNMYQKENWIDFESEISKVIQSLDGDMHGLSGNYSMNDDIYSLSNDFLSKKYSEYSHAARSLTALTYGKVKRVSFKEIKDKLFNDLNKLIRALEIYLCEYVEKIEINKKSSDIDKSEIDFILSFNYTHIFSKLYNVSNRSKKEIADPFDYIHGETNISNTVESNNMVLGIDEYLPEDRKNKDVDFIAFKKFYQRIYKQTGCEYKKWMEKIQRGYIGSLDTEANCKRFLEYAMMRKDIEDASQWLIKMLDHSKERQSEIHNLYIFGHSLDVTDKDILRDLILNDNVYTTIYYPDKKELGRKITNLVKVIGQNELIRRTGGSTKTIQFVLQNPMEPVINQ